MVSVIILTVVMVKMVDSGCRMSSNKIILIVLVNPFAVNLHTVQFAEATAFGNTRKNKKKKYSLWNGCL
jgi:hypothetical protein